MRLSKKRNISLVFFDKNRGAFDTQTGKIKEIYLPK
jgi:hypothetical protein